MKGETTYKTAPKDKLTEGLGGKIKFFTFIKLNNHGSKLLLPMHKSEKLERGGPCLLLKLR
jgi:hypothetical protein